MRCCVLSHSTKHSRRRIPLLLLFFIGFSVLLLPRLKFYCDDSGWWPVTKASLMQIYCGRGILCEIDNSTKLSKKTAIKHIAVNITYKIAVQINLWTDPEPDNYPVRPGNKTPQATQAYRSPSPPTPPPSTQPGCTNRKSLKFSHKSVRSHSNAERWPILAFWGRIVRAQTANIHRKRLKLSNVCDLCVHHQHNPINSRSILMGNFVVVFIAVFFLLAALSLLLPCYWFCFIYARLLLSLFSQSPIH